MVGTTYADIEGKSMAYFVFEDECEFFTAQQGTRFRTYGVILWQKILLLFANAKYPTVESRQNILSDCY